MDHGRTVVTIIGHAIIGLASVGKSAIQWITNTLIIERSILYHDIVLFNIAHSFSRSLLLLRRGESVEATSRDRPSQAVW